MHPALHLQENRRGAKVMRSSGHLGALMLIAGTARGPEVVRAVNTASGDRHDVIHVQIDTLPDRRPADVADVWIELPSETRCADSEAARMVTGRSPAPFRSVLPSVLPVYVAMRRPIGSALRAVGRVICRLVSLGAGGRAGFPFLAESDNRYRIASLPLVTPSGIYGHLLSLGSLAISGVPSRRPGPGLFAVSSSVWRSLRLHSERISGTMSATLRGRLFAVSGIPGRLCRSQLDTVRSEVSRVVRLDLRGVPHLRLQMERPASGYWPKTGHEKTAPVLPTRSFYTFGAVS